MAARKERIVSPHVREPLIHVTDIGDNQAVWRARQEFFTGDFPTSTLVQVAALATPETKVEITLEAYVGCGR